MPEQLGSFNSAEINSIHDEGELFVMGCHTNSIRLQKENFVNFFNFDQAIGIKTFVEIFDFFMEFLSQSLRSLKSSS